MSVIYRSANAVVRRQLGHDLTETLKAEPDRGHETSCESARTSYAVYLNVRLEVMAGWARIPEMSSLADGRCA